MKDILEVKKARKGNSYLACSWTPTISTSLSEEAILISSLIWGLPEEVLSLARKPGSKWPVDGGKCKYSQCLTAYTTEKSAGKGISQAKKKRLKHWDWKIFLDQFIQLPVCRLIPDGHWIYPVSAALVMVLSHKCEQSPTTASRTRAVIRLSSCYFTTTLRARLHLSLSEIKKQANLLSMSQTPWCCGKQSLHTGQKHHTHTKEN